MVRYLFHIIPMTITGATPPQPPKQRPSRPRRAPPFWLRPVPKKSPYLVSENRGSTKKLEVEAILRWRFDMLSPAENGALASDKWSFKQWQMEVSQCEPAKTMGVARRNRCSTAQIGVSPGKMEFSPQKPSVFHHGLNQAEPGKSLGHDIYNMGMGNEHPFTSYMIYYRYIHLNFWTSLLTHIQSLLSILT